MYSAVIALAVWEADNYNNEPFGWNRAKTRDENGEWVYFRRRPDLQPESEYVEP